MENLKEEFSKQTNRLATDMRDKARRADLHLNDIAHTAGERIGHMASAIAESANERVNEGRQYIRENPIRGVAIAAAAGLVAGGLVTLAMRGRRS